MDRLEQRRETEMETKLKKRDRGRQKYIHRLRENVQ